MEKGKIYKAKLQCLNCWHSWRGKIKLGALEGITKIPGRMIKERYSAILEPCPRCSSKKVDICKIITFNSQLKKYGEVA